MLSFVHVETDVVTHAHHCCCCLILTLHQAITVPEHTSDCITFSTAHIQSFTVNWEKCCQEVPTGSRRETELLKGVIRQVQPWELYDKVDKSVEVRMLCRTSNSEVVQTLLKQTWNLLARKHGTCTRTDIMSKGLQFKHEEILPTSQQDNSRESCHISVRLRT